MKRLPIKNRIYRLFKIQSSGLILFSVFCLIPERFLAAGLLSIFLAVILMVVNRTLPDANKGLSKQANTNLRTKKASPIGVSKRFSAAIKKEPGQKSILKLVEKRPGFGMPFSTARLRSRNEMNDQIMESRIRSLFENIRDADNNKYLQGLQEIQCLLELRQKSLKGLTPANKIS